MTPQDKALNEAQVAANAADIAIEDADWSGYMRHLAMAQTKAVISQAITMRELLRTLDRIEDRIARLYR